MLHDRSQAAGGPSPPSLLPPLSTATPLAMNNIASSQRQRGGHDLPAGASAGADDDDDVSCSCDADQCVAQAQVVQTTFHIHGSAGDQGVVSIDGDNDTDGNTRRYEYHGSDEDSDCDHLDDDDVPEIIELRKFLEYLVTDRDIKKVYNSSSDNNSTTSRPTNEGDSDKNEELLYLVPNLVNRILIEHYSPNNLHDKRSQAHDDVRSNNVRQKMMTRRQKEKMNQLLLAVIVEFSEPYFARVVRHRREQAQTKELLTQQLSNWEKKKKRSRTNLDNPPLQSNSQRMASHFDERAVSWATACIDQLIRPPTASYVSSNRNNGNVRCNNERSHTYHRVDNYHIPELDALLAASGPHDGLEAEDRMQSALMHSLQSRRALRSNGMLSRKEGTIGCTERIPYT